MAVSRVALLAFSTDARFSPERPGMFTSRSTRSGRICWTRFVVPKLCVWVKTTYPSASRMPRVEMRWATSSSMTRIRLLLMSRFLSIRDAHGKRRSAGEFALHGDRAAEQVQQLAGDRQADAGALVTLRLCVLELCECFEQPLQVFRADADAAVDDADDDLARDGVERLPHFDAAGVRELRGIAGEVDDDLPKLDRISPQDALALG